MKELKNLLLISLGSYLLAFGVTFFLIPVNIATGGTPGMSIILHYLTDIPTALAMVLINIPLVIAGLKFIDFPFAIRTVIAIILTATFVGSLPKIISFPPIDSILLSTIYGGVCIGAGIAIVMKGQASAGGTTIVAQIVARYSSFRSAQVIMFFDMIIIIAVAIVFKDMELALWSLIGIYVTTKVIDKILTGAVAEKVVHIISNQTDSIGLAISEELGRDGTILAGENLIEQNDQKVLLAVVGARQIPKLQTIVLSRDKNAVVLVMDASEMIGSTAHTTT
ncbi:MAG: YitT family protein [Colwellia sp.]|nr:YitT family protein [Colwellia sp.]